LLLIIKYTKKYTTLIFYLHNYQLVVSHRLYTQQMFSY
jgi:hypothetical protein